ncbi:MAG: hypothetical protein AB8B58_04780 [Roseobacter sp.]
MTTNRPDSFEKFYFTKVATGEGCGCAERVIDVHEFNSLAGNRRPRLKWWPRKGSLRRFMNKAGLTSRPKR